MDQTRIRIFRIIAIANMASRPGRSAAGVHRRPSQREMLLRFWTTLTGARARHQTSKPVRLNYHNEAGDDTS